MLNAACCAWAEVTINRDKLTRRLRLIRAQSGMSASGEVQWSQSSEEFISDSLTASWNLTSFHIRLFAAQLLISSSVLPYSISSLYSLLAYTNVYLILPYSGSSHFLFIHSFLLFPFSFVTQMHLYSILLSLCYYCSLYTVTLMVLSHFIKHFLTILTSSSIFLVVFLWNDHFPFQFIPLNMGEETNQC